MTPPTRRKTIRRSMIRWLGGKTRDGGWICKHFPEHRTFVDAFGGGASVLLKKKPSEVEVLNDLDDDLVNLYLVVQHPELWKDLGMSVWCIPYDKRSLLNPRPEHPVDRAAWIVARGNIAHNALGTSGFRGWKDRPDGTSMMTDHLNYENHVEGFHHRLKDVIVHHDQAIDVMRDYDHPWTLHYCDPPYVPDLRKDATKHPYNHDMTREQHVELLQCIMSLQGSVVISGYDGDLYNDTLVGWQKISKKAVDQSGDKRVECIWLNPLATWNNEADIETRFWQTKHGRHEKKRLRAVEKSRALGQFDLLDIA